MRPDKDIGPACVQDGASVLRLDDQQGCDWRPTLLGHRAAVLHPQVEEATLVHSNTTTNPTTPPLTDWHARDWSRLDGPCASLHEQAERLELNEARALEQALLVINSNARALPLGMAHREAGGAFAAPGALHEEITPEDLAHELRAKLAEARALLARLGAGLDLLDATSSASPELQGLADRGSVPS